jgi:type I restriction enzyme, S subunit
MKNGWPVVTLGDLCERITKGSSPKWQGFKYVDKPGVLFVTSENVRENEMSFDKPKYVEEAFNEKDTRSILKPGDVLTNLVGASIGRTAIYDRDDVANINQAVGILRCEPDHLYNRFLAFLLNSPVFTEILHDNEVNNARANLSLTFFKNLEIPLPKLPEQRRIVGILDEAFAGIATAKANAEKNLQNARALFESHLNAVFTQRGDGWVEKTLADISRINSGGTPLKSSREFWNGGHIPWYSSGELNDVYTTDSKKFITERGLNNSNAKLLPKGSLLMGMYDTAALKMSILDREATFNQAVAGMFPVEGFDSMFLLYAVRHVRPKVLKLRRGVRQKNLSLAKIKAIEIRVPNKIEQQKEVVDRILLMKAECEQLESIYQRKLAALDELKKSLLHQAFSGQL